MAVERMRILIIEDDEDTRALYEVVFISEGFEARVAASLRDGLATLAEWRPHVVVCDLHLPDGSGIDAVRRLRVSGDRTPVIAVTGTVGAAERDEAVDAGFSEYIVKPCLPDVLVDAVGRLAARPPGPPSRVGRPSPRVRA
jgi:two-component system cell cycle response regulator DivK